MKKRLIPMSIEMTNPQISQNKANVEVTFKVTYLCIGNQIGITDDHYKKCIFGTIGPLIDQDVPIFGYRPSFDNSEKL